MFYFLISSSALEIKLRGCVYNVPRRNSINVGSVTLLKYVQERVDACKVVNSIRNLRNCIFRDETSHSNFLSVIVLQKSFYTVIERMELNYAFLGVISILKRAREDGDNTRQ